MTAGEGAGFTCFSATTGSAVGSAANGGVGLGTTGLSMLADGPAEGNGTLGAGGGEGSELAWLASAGCGDGLEPAGLMIT